MYRLSQRVSLQSTAGRGQNKRHVIVVGAGIAGLAAAQTLQTAGAGVTIIEARERVGGRIWTDRTLGVPVDMGASWIHGADGNPIAKLAADENIQTVLSDDDALVAYHANGEVVADTELDTADIEMEAFTEEVLDTAENLDDDVSIAHGIQTALAGERLSAVERWWFETVIELDYAAPLAQLSLFYALEDDAFGGGDWWFPDGYEQIPAVLAQGLDIRLNETVRAIIYNNRRVTVETDVETHAVDAVIVTLPLGVLKAGAVQFDPPLPTWKTSAIQRLGMGHLEKVALRFPEVFWDRDVEFIGQLDSPFPLFMDLHRFTGEPVLLGFTINEAAGLTGDDTARAIDTLRRAYGADVSAPTGAAVSRWGADPLTGGSYSVRLVGATLQDHQTLAEPVGERLFFAGEATHTGHNATVHGAYLSGVRAAQQAL